MSSGWIKTATVGTVVGEVLVRQDRHGSELIQIRLRSGDEDDAGHCVFLDHVIAGRNVAKVKEMAKPGNQLFISGKLECTPRKNSEGCDYMRVFANSAEIVELIGDS
jgi:single-stranded DNA-binding protein